MAIEWKKLAYEASVVSLISDHKADASAHHSRYTDAEASAFVRNLVVSNWTIRSSAADNGWRSVCWSPSLTLFVAVANTGVGNRVMTSPDGINWTIRSSAADNDWLSVCWSPDLTLFVAVANTGDYNRVMTSPDGINWTIRSSTSRHTWISVCWSPDLTLFVAVSYSGAGDRAMTSLFYGN